MTLQSGGSSDDNGGMPRHPRPRTRLRSALLAAVVGGALLAACAPPPPPPPPPPPEPITPIGTARDLPVSTATFRFVDPTRSTPAFGAYPGASTRTLTTTVWYPTERAGPYPLVVFAHGYGVTPRFYAALLARIASAGYVVAAPTLPLLSGTPAGPTDDVDWDAKYGDLQFVTTQVLDRSTAGDPVLGGQIDPARIAVAGHSDGAQLAFGDGFEAGRTDARVRAVVAYAAYLGGGHQYQANGRALLHFASEHDEYNDVGETVAWDHATLGGPYWTVMVWGGAHAPPYTSPADSRFEAVASMSVDFLDAQLKTADDDPFLFDATRFWPQLAFT